MNTRKNLSTNLTGKQSNSDSKMSDKLVVENTESLRKRFNLTRPGLPTYGRNNLEIYTAK